MARRAANQSIAVQTAMKADANLKNANGVSSKRPENASAVVIRTPCSVYRQAFPCTNFHGAENRAGNSREAHAFKYCAFAKGDKERVAPAETPSAPRPRASPAHFPEPRIQAPVFSSRAL